MMLRVVVADDHGLMREGIVARLVQESDLEPVGVAADGQEALRQAEALQPDVVVMDLVMPVLNGFEATRLIVSSFPDTRVVALDDCADRRALARVMSCGALGYVVKTCGFDELLRAIRTVADYRRHISTGVNPNDGALTEGFVDDGEVGALELTSRERQVAQLLSEGCTTRRTAELLEISIKTAETHRANIFRKLGIRSIAQLTKYAIRERLTQL